MNKAWRVLKHVLGFERKPKDDLQALREVLTKEFRSKGWDLEAMKVALAIKIDARLKQADKTEKERIDLAWQDLQAYRNAKISNVLETHYHWGA